MVVVKGKSNEFALLNILIRQNCAKRLKRLDVLGTAGTDETPSVISAAVFPSHSISGALKVSANWNFICNALEALESGVTDIASSRNTSPKSK